ncbi:MAG TPA: hypothetical protein H9880_11970 [Candidatus Anaerobutyricum avicola]|nr:hypothetical protein [Candidatus Anaerobutyricum avicola]
MPGKERQNVRTKDYKQDQTFILKILDRKNSTWQGSILWVDKRNEQYFRSALEMLKLIDEALIQNENETGGDNHEE